MPRRLAPLLIALAPAALLLASCATPAVTEPAPSASDPVCGLVLQWSPRELAGQPLRETTSQASLAWGDPPITLRCGVEPLPPTTDRCIEVTDEDGLSVFWVVKENDDVVGADTERGRFVFTTYGRVPAVQVEIPVEYAGNDATALLGNLASAISYTEQERSCY